MLVVGFSSDYFVRQNEIRKKNYARLLRAVRKQVFRVSALALFVCSKLLMYFNLYLSAAELWPAIMHFTPHLTQLINYFPSNFYRFLMFCTNSLFNARHTCSRLEIPFKFHASTTSRRNFFYGRAFNRTEVDCKQSEDCN